jgi:hypothetical protein
MKLNSCLKTVSASRVLVTEQCGREFGVALQQSVLSIVVTIRYLDTSLVCLDTVCFISE